MSIVFRNRYGVSLKFEGKLYCEINPKKQEWLRQQLQPDVLVADVHSLAAESAKNISGPEEHLTLL
eukprot:2737369-Lingulodinium_polyedra.AAC.1